MKHTQIFCNVIIQCVFNKNQVHSTVPATERSLENHSTLMGIQPSIDSFAKVQSWLALLFRYRGEASMSQVAPRWSSFTSVTSFSCTLLKMYYLRFLSSLKFIYILSSFHQLENYDSLWELIDLLFIINLISD